MRIRDYAVSEPSFTIPFAMWELGLGRTPLDVGVEWLLEHGIVREIEPKRGIYAAVYEYVPPTPSRTVTRLFPELDDSRIAGVGSQAQQRGKIVPHTRSEGPSGKPGKDKARAQRGVRLKRQRQGT